MLEKVRERVELVRSLVENLFDPGVNQNFEAVDAWCVGDVDGCVFDAGAILGCLRDGVDLGVDRAKAILFDLAVGGFGLIDETSRVCAMGHACRGAVVARGNDVFVTNDNSSHFRPVASRALSHLTRDG